MKILVVEDNEALARLTVRILEAAGHEVLLSTSVADAIAAIESWTPETVLTDLRLPDGSGTSVAEAARGRARVVAITGEDALSPQVKALFDATLVKPVANADLLAALAGPVSSG